MKRISWVLSLVLLAASSLKPAVYAEITIGQNPPAADTGSAVAAGEDTGTGVEEFKPPKSEENKWMPWILGIGSAVIALAAGFLVADGNSSDAQDSADAAAASAAATQAATAATAAAAAAAASNTTAAAAAAAAQADAALAAATDPTGPFNTRLFITGDFVGSSGFSSHCGTTITPSLTFSISQAGNFPGGITGFTSTSTCTPSGKGGSWEQTGDNTILIRVDDAYYLGEAVIVGTTEIKLASGGILRAVPGSGVRLVKKD
jgi:hypothetical protein